MTLTEAERAITALAVDDEEIEPVTSGSALADAQAQGSAAALLVDDDEDFGPVTSSSTKSAAASACLSTSLSTNQPPPPDSSSSSNEQNKTLRFEGNPYKSASYIFFTLQFMTITLDLFVETSEIPPWHYAMTAIEFAMAVLLAMHQVARLSGIKSSGCFNKAVPLLLLSLSIQLLTMSLNIIWFDIANNDTFKWGEWTLFGTSIAWGFINPATYVAVEELRNIDEEGSSTSKKKRLSPGQAAASIFTKHFSRTPLLFVTGAIFAIGQAILTTLQGATINALTRTVTKVSPDTDQQTLDQELLSLSVQLICIWAGRNACRFLFDLSAAAMFSKLEVWLRGAVFERAVEYAAHPDSSKGPGTGSRDPASEFQARYASDVTGVVALYGTLLRGVIVNILLIITNFIFLCMLDYRVGVSTLGFLAMGITGGPTDLAGDAASSVQKTATEGLGLVGDAVRNSPTIQTTPNLDKNLAKKHETDVLVPLEKGLFAQVFFANSVDTYMNFISSFLTVIVVITMVFQVSDGEMDSSDFLGTFFVFKELQKPAMKISAVLKSAVKRSANVARLHDVIFPSDEDAVTVDGDDDSLTFVGDEEKNSCKGTLLAADGVSGGDVSNLSLELTAGQFTCVAGRQREDVAGILSGAVTLKKGKLVASGTILSQKDVVAISATLFSTPSVFSGSVGWNVTASRPEATQDEIFACLERTELADAVSKLPGGLEADVGVAQDSWTDNLLIRLAIARTLLRSQRPLVWVLPNFGVGGKLESHEWKGLIVLLRSLVLEEGGALVMSTADPDLKILSDRVLDVDANGVAEDV